mmetsp:Transcript_29777/g.91164  ORF Transcript_29777/g.91164 Transcript_29777/m.91164 type:complete len:347 (+) Transcript_29777:768-1808(+)
MFARPGAAAGVLREGGRRHFQRHGHPRLGLGAVPDGVGADGDSGVGHDRREPGNRRLRRPRKVRHRHDRRQVRQRPRSRDRRLQTSALRLRPALRGVGDRRLSDDEQRLPQHRVPLHARGLRPRRPPLQLLHVPLPRGLRRRNPRLHRVSRLRPPRAHHGPGRPHRAHHGRSRRKVRPRKAMGLLRRGHRRRPRRGALDAPRPRPPRQRSRHQGRHRRRLPPHRLRTRRRHQPRQRQRRPQPPRRVPLRTGNQLPPHHRRPRPGRPLGPPGLRRFVLCLPPPTIMVFSHESVVGRGTSAGLPSFLPPSRHILLNFSSSCVRSFLCVCLCGSFSCCPSRRRSFLSVV